MKKTAVVRRSTATGMAPGVQNTHPPRVRFGETPSVGFRKGVAVSLFLHLIFGITVVIVLERTAANAGGMNQVFSVTLEGGMSLGGISQVPKPGAKKILTPEQNQDETAPDKPEKKEPEQKKTEERKSVEEKTVEKVEEKHLTVPSAVEDPAKKLAEKRAEEERERKVAEEKRKVEQEKKEREKEDKEKKKKEDEKKREENEKKEKEKQREARDKQLTEALKRVQHQYEGESADAGGKGFGAATLGGKGMGGGTLASLEKIAYENELKRHVKQGWHWPGGSDRLQASVKVRILQNGQLQDPRIESSSGNRNFDDSVIRAVNEASPVPAPPPSLYEDYKVSIFTFDSRDQ